MKEKEWLSNRSENWVCIKESTCNGILFYVQLRNTLYNNCNTTGTWGRFVRPTRDHIFKITEIPTSI